MGPDDTLLVQSGKPVGVVRTHDMAPRVLIANSLLVPKWATPEYFRELEDLGLIMYGQMTAGSWIYIGTQGILQGTFETFAEVGAQALRRHPRRPAGAHRRLGGMGGAQPLAITGNGGVALCVEVDPTRAQRRRDHGYLDEVADSLGRRARPLCRRRTGPPGAVRRRDRQLRRRLPRAAAARCAGRRGDRPDQRPRRAARLRAARHAARRGGRVAARQARRVRRAGTRLDGRALPGHGGPAGGGRGSCSTTATACAARRGTPASPTRSTTRASSPPTSARCSARAPDRSAGRRCPATRPTSPPQTPLCSRRSRTTTRCTGGWSSRPAKVKGQGLPSRICWLGYGERHVAGEVFNDLVAGGEVTAPIVIGRDHLDAGSVASPERETEAMRDGSDAIADWPILNALLNTASGASWVSVHHGGGVGIGKSIHAGS
jgi:urocanate hydratase